MELYQLAYFLEAARQRNFTRAAIKLNLAQAALSEQIRKLEEEFGTRLFHRGKRETTLTATGETLREHAEALLDRATATKTAMQDLVNLKSGRLAVGAVPSVSACVLPSAVAAFRKRHPGVELSLHEGTSEQVAGWVESGRVEFGIVQLPLTTTHLVSETLFTETFVLLVPRGHAASQRNQISLEKLREESFVLYKGKARDTAMTACRNAGFEPRIACESSELETIRSLVGAGLGVAILPQLAVRQTPADCTVIRLKGVTILREMVMITRVAQVLSPSAVAFRKLVMAKFRTRTAI
jgi:LysR family transcriptional regulator, hydrogen peroxide-inducible genes activator